MAVDTELKVNVDEEWIRLIYKCFKDPEGSAERLQIQGTARK